MLPKVFVLVNIFMIYKESKYIVILLQQPVSYNSSDKEVK